MFRIEIECNKFFNLIDISLICLVCHFEMRCALSHFVVRTCTSHAFEIEIEIADSVDVHKPDIHFVPYRIRKWTKKKQQKLARIFIMRSIKRISFEFNFVIVFSSQRDELAIELRNECRFGHFIDWNRNSCVWARATVNQLNWMSFMLLQLMQ